MLKIRGVIRPMVTIVVSIGMVSILAPDLWVKNCPDLAAPGVMIVPLAVYRWWDTRYNPGCSVRYRKSASE